MKYKITECFYSVQGEGLHSGMPAIFIRFAGCNMNPPCSFCDTDFKKKYEWSIENLIERIHPYGCENVILTGGEPTIQEDLTLLSTALMCEGYTIHLETNGSNRDISKHDYHWITVSPKSIESWKLKKGDELKLVYTGKESKDYLDYMSKMGNFDYRFLQPESNKPELVKEIIEIIKKNNIWRLSLQCQKIINIK